MKILLPFLFQTDNTPDGWILECEMMQLKVLAKVLYSDLKEL